jgi:hypothetical protein
LFGDRATVVFVGRDGLHQAPVGISQHVTGLIRLAQSHKSIEEVLSTYAAVLIMNPGKPMTISNGFSWARSGAAQEKLSASIEIVARIRFIRVPSI